MFILMLLYHFCLSSAQFHYIIVYIRKVESYMQVADLCAPFHLAALGSSLYRPGADPTENTVHNSSIVFVGGYLAITCILLACLPAVNKQCMFLLAIVV
jgi:hypothetical protein